jgi:hypothetical protein
MYRVNYCIVVCCLNSISLVLCGCGGGASTGSVSPPGSVQLSVHSTSAGSGMISSNPPGINCSQACSASFVEGTEVTLTASPMVDSFFAGWSGACTGIGACKVTLTKNVSAIASFSPWPVLAVNLTGFGKGSDLLSVPMASHQWICFQTIFATNRQTAAWRRPGRHTLPVNTPS